MSLVLSYTRANRAGVFQKYLRRGAKVFGTGLIITLVTYLFLGQGFIVFGILHLIGFSIIAAYPFVPYKQRYVSLMAAGISVGLGIYLGYQVSAAPWLIWLGVKQAGRFMLDYYPVMPWFGLALVGIFAGHALYPGGIPRLVWPDKSNTHMVKALSFLGRHSLLIYLIHQPILLGLLILLGIGSI